MTKEEIINYVMNTPENTNPAVLKSMLEEIESGSGTGGNPNYVETIEGTLESLLSNETTFKSLWAAQFNNGASAYLQFNITNGDDIVPFCLMANPLSTIEFDSIGEPSSSEEFGEYMIGFSWVNESGNRIDANEVAWVSYLWNDEQNAGDVDERYYVSAVGTANRLTYTQLSRDIPATLTIIHHPLPDSGS